MKNLTKYAYKEESKSPHKFFPRVTALYIELLDTIDKKPFKIKNDTILKYVFPDASYEQLEDFVRKKPSANAYLYPVKHVVYNIESINTKIVIYDSKSFIKNITTDKYTQGFFSDTNKLIVVPVLFLSNKRQLVQEISSQDHDVIYHELTHSVQKENVSIRIFNRFRNYYNWSHEYEARFIQAISSWMHSEHDWYQHLNSYKEFRKSFDRFITEYKKLDFLNRQRYKLNTYLLFRYLKANKSSVVKEYLAILDYYIKYDLTEKDEENKLKQMNIVLKKLRKQIKNITKQIGKAA